MSFLDSAIGAVGAAVGNFVTMELEDWKRMARMPKPRVLSSHATIVMKMPNISGNANPDLDDVEIGEIDNIAFNKSFTVVKKWKPFGSKFDKVLLEDCGWDITWTGGKVNWNLAYLTYAQEKLLSGMDISNSADASNTFNGSTMLYQQLVFSIRSDIRHYDGSVESYIYNDVKILTFSQEFSGNNEHIVEKVTAFSPSRTMLPGISNDKTTKINDRLSDIIANMIFMNRS